MKPWYGNMGPFLYNVSMPSFLLCEVIQAASQWNCAAQTRLPCPCNEKKANIWTCKTPLGRLPSLLCWQRSDGSLMWHYDFFPPLADFVLPRHHTHKSTHLVLIMGLSAASQHTHGLPLLWSCHLGLRSAYVSQTGNYVIPSDIFLKVFSTYLWLGVFSLPTPSSQTEKFKPLITISHILAVHFNNSAPTAWTC